MTAVASPPAIHPLPRWNSGSSVIGGFNGDSMNTEDYTRILAPRKSLQRTNSNSSTSSTMSTSTTISAPAPAPTQTHGDTPAMNGDPGGWGPRKKPNRGLWSSSKGEPTSGITNIRPQPPAPTSSGHSAASAISAMHQAVPILPPAQSRSQPQTQHQGGARSDGVVAQVDSNIVLVLLPMTGTFERKHIAVPYSPDVLKIGRQTNAKTVPTPVNGYFDSKVLSRTHAEIWAERNGQVMIKDVKSSNGTFVNSIRLSPENKESEPHPLKEGDILELGIDIVSEDQKSIVHHKVSAKVEHAGVWGHANVGDISFGEGAAGGSAPSMAQQGILRGRNGSQGALNGNARLAGLAANDNAAFGVQRQMNYWMNPVSVEQVMKKLTTELRSAKQHSQDLQRTGEFFNTLLTLEPGQEPPQPPQEQKSMEVKSTDNRSRPQDDPLSPFSHPPAPPPQQPLPEKPDSASLGIPSALAGGLLRRADTERASPSVSPSRTDGAGSQILTLVEALETAKQQLDSQGKQVERLEGLLVKERKARESAEERAKSLLEGRGPPTSPNETGNLDQDAFEPPADTVELENREQYMTNGYQYHLDDDNLSTASTSTMNSAPEALKHVPNDHAEISTSRLQSMLDVMTHEMNQMKTLMESYRQRAEGAEEEKKTLAQMVESIRAQQHSHSALSSSSAKDFSGSDLGSDHSGNNPLATSRSPPTPPADRSSRNSSGSDLAHRRLSAGDVISGPLPEFKAELERTVSTVLQQQQRHGGGLAAQSAPYASMVGVVLIGVGIMTWINGWQRGE